MSNSDNLKKDQGDDVSRLGGYSEGWGGGKGGGGGGGKGDGGGVNLQSLENSGSNATFLFL